MRKIELPTSCINSIATAFICASWWPNNPGHVIVIPNQHYENIFDFPDEVSTAIHRMARQIALALMTAYECEGISSRQHNGPCGNQDVWHYHLHVFPRYEGDDLYKSSRRSTTPEERVPYSSELKAFFSDRNSAYHDRVRRKG